MHMCAYTETYRYNTDISGVTIAHRLNSILDYGKEDVYVSECVCLCMCLSVCVCEYTLGARPRRSVVTLWRAANVYSHTHMDRHMHRHTHSDTYTCSLP